MKTKEKYLDIILKYTVAAILIAVPLFPKFPFIAVKGTFVSIRLEDLLLAFSAIVLIFVFSGRLKNIFEDRLNKAIVIYFCSGLLSLVSAIYITHSVNAFLGLLHLFRRIEYVIPFYLGFEAIQRDRKNLIFFVKIILIVLVFVFIYGYGQKNFDWPVIITQNEEYSKGIALRYMPGGHINSTFAGHYDLASYLILILPMIYTAIFLIKNNLNKLILSTPFFMGMWLLVNTASRISLVSFLFSVCLSLILVKKLKAIPIIIVITIIFASFSSNLIARYQRIIDVVEIKFKQTNNLIPTVMAATDTNVLPKRKIENLTPTPQPVFEDRSANIRLNVEWPRAFRALSKNPLLGTGYSSITLATDNDYLRLLGEVGIFGFLAFILLILRIIITLLNKYPFSKMFKGLELAYVAGLTAAIPGVLLNAFFIDIFEASKFAISFWLFMGILISLTRYDSNNSKNI